MERRRRLGRASRPLAAPSLNTTRHLMARIRVIAWLREVGTTRSGVSHSRRSAMTPIRTLIWMNSAFVASPSLTAQPRLSVRHDLAHSPAAEILLLAVAALLLLLVLWHLTRSVRLVSIRSRLFVGFLLRALVPASFFGIVAAAVAFQSGRQQVLDQLESFATIKEAELNTWVDNVQNDLVSTLVAEQDVEYVRDILSAPPETGEYQVAYIQVGV